MSNMELHRVYTLFLGGKHNLTKTYIINMAIGLLIVLTVAGFGTIASAQESATTSIEQQRQILEERREAIAASTTSTTVSDSANQTRQRVQLNEQTQQRLTNLAALLSNRMETTIRRLENTTGRLDSRMTKMEAAGTDTTEARTALASAKQSLAVATTLLKDIDLQVQNFVSSEDPRTAWFEVKETYVSAKGSILAAHQQLRTCISLLKNPPANTANSNQASI